MISRYLDPKNDLAFKKYLAKKKNKRIPIAFLNVALNLKREDTV